MDMLIRLYDPAVAGGPGAALPVEVRKPIGPEHDLVVGWIGAQFGPAWASEARVALGNRPPTLFVATGGDPPRVLGFCAYDATARGLLGPIGVAADARGNGVGAALLLACLRDMRAFGYAYAVVGGVAVPEFFHRVAGASVIEDYGPGIYRGMLRP